MNQEFQFTSRTPNEMVAELNRNREMAPGHLSIQDILGKNKEKSASPNIDRETGMPVAGKYMQDGQEQNAPRVAGALQEKEREEEQGRERGQRQQGQGIS
jgi:hypothetical protein